MKPEPLKGKIVHWIKNEDYDGKAPIIRITDDIKSAVDWLKQSILNDYNKKAGKKGSYYTLSILKQNVLEFIDLAFEDVK